MEQVATDRRRKVILGTIAAVLLIVAGIIAATRLWGGAAVAQAAPETAWFYDTQTGVVYPVHASEVPPSTAPSGGTGVKAHVYSCGDCDAEADRQVAYLESFRPEAKESMTGAAGGPPGGTGAYQSSPQMRHRIATQAGRVVATPNPSGEERWLQADSEQGLALINQAVITCPDGKRAVACYPPKSAIRQ